MMRAKKGFTLTEILVTVVVLAVLAALMIPRFSGQSERGVVAEAVAMLSAIRQAEAAYLLENSSYTATLTDLDIDDPNAAPNPKFNYAFNTGMNATTAQRIGGGTFAGNTIILNMDGTWDQSASHPFKPK
ncbi:MAG: prepilin-type N-terminal cleavage/methylation domain-containing protein [Candidatus Omnitrophota bacterium]